MSRLPHSVRSFLVLPFTWKVHDSIFLFSWTVFYSIYVPVFHYPHIGWRTFTLFPFTSYCKKQQWAWLNKCFLIQVLWASQCGITGLYGVFILKTSPLWFPRWLNQAGIPPTVSVPFFPTAFSVFFFFCQFPCWSLPFWLITMGRLWNTQLLAS